MRSVPTPFFNRFWLNFSLNLNPPKLLKHMMDALNQQPVFCLLTKDFLNSEDVSITMSLAWWWLAGPPFPCRQKIFSTLRTSSWVFQLCWFQCSDESRSPDGPGPLFPPTALLAPKIFSTLPSVWLVMSLAWQWPTFPTNSIMLRTPETLGNI